MSEHISPVHHEVIPAHTRRIHMPDWRMNRHVRRGAAVLASAAIALSTSRSGNAEQAPLDPVTPTQETRVGFNVIPSCNFQFKGIDLDFSPPPGYTYNEYFKDCRDQYLLQIQTLKDWNVKDARVWMFPREILGDTASNVNEIINAYSDAGISLNVVLDSSYLCNERNDMSYDKRIYTDPQIREDFIARAELAVESLAKNKNVKSIDPLNEGRREFIMHPGVQCDGLSYTQEDVYAVQKEYISRVRDHAKAINPDIKMVYSVDNLTDSPNFAQTMSYVSRLAADGLMEELDIHVYNQKDPAAPFELIKRLKQLYPDLANLPIIHGEAGMITEEQDNDCYQKEDNLTPMTPECMEILKNLTRRNILEAMNNGSLVINLHSYSGKRYDSPLIDPVTKKVIGYIPTPAAQCVIDTNNGVPKDKICI